MKVIVAGMPKTGSKTMAAALQTLGYKVYDYMENYTYLGNEWNKIITRGGSTQDFQRMFDNVDAVTDLPCCIFWEEIHQAFPQAKIIFMQRESEDEWWDSFKRQVTTRDLLRRMMAMLSPTYKIFINYSNRLWLAMFGCYVERPLLQPTFINELLLRMAYRRHNAYLLQRAPEDKLLVFNIRDGWEPICNFLRLPIPNTPFPHKNKQASLTNTMIKVDPLFIRMQREMYISAGLIAAVIAYGAYKITVKTVSI